MKKTCVLFGAGADIPFGISGGKSFALKVLGFDAVDMNSAIREYFRSKLPNFEHKTWYPPYEQTTWKEKDIVEAAVKKKLLSTEDTISFKKEYDQQVQDAVDDLMNNNKSQERYEIIEAYTSYMGLIDEKFHTIISPKALGPNKFWSVISCYTRAYLLIVGEIIGKAESRILGKDDYLNILCNPKDTFDRIVTFCSSQTSKESYYSIIYNMAREDIGIITTNYTPLCQTISGITDDKIAYIHGRLNWFESPYNLQVYDVNREQLPNELCFPYLFIQSGIKPIVDAVQINEYAKMLQLLRDSEQLVIVGYRLNSDDNHINGIIKTYLNQKEVVYLDFDKGTTENDILKRLRLDTNKNLKYIKIDASNAYCIFQECLSQ